MASDIALSTHTRRVRFALSREVVWAGLLLAGLVLVAWLLRALWRGPLAFDDAYMFWRYALRLREGGGLAWNPGGDPTYGLTSQLWVFLVLPFTWLPVPPGAGLQLASWLTGAAGLAVIARAVTAGAHSSWLSQWPVALLAVALPLLPNPVFAAHLTSGMDTMLSFLAQAGLALGLLRYLAVPVPALRMARGAEAGRAVAVGLLAVVAVLARPENGLCALGAPALAWAFHGRRAWRDLAGLLLLPMLLLGLSLALSWWYFGVPLPLSFYAKSMRAYAGFQGFESALGYLRLGLPVAMPFLALLLACLTRRHLALAASFLLPVAATFLYLLTVLQVMGMGARYYVPFLPWLIIPALLSLDAALARGTGGVSLRRTAVILLLGFGAYLVARPSLQAAEVAWHKARLEAPVPEPSLPIDAPDRLPATDWLRTILVLGKEVAAPLPPGASIAASEVGYLGAVAPGVTVIDLVGLNDTRIARRGLSMDDLLARAPDLIWLPHTHYTGLRAAILRDPRLFDAYEVFDHAFSYGVAVRKDSAARDRIEAGLRAGWAALYPGRAMEDYRVHAAPPAAAP